MLSNLPPHIQQRLAVLIPIVALALSLFVVYPGWKSYRELVNQAQDKRAKLETLRNTPIPLAATREPAVPATPSEPPEFLASIREIAHQSGCEVVGFDLTLPPAPATGEKELALGGNPDPLKQEQEKQKEKPKLVKPVRAKIEVEAPYPRIRSFVWNISRARRLYAVAGLEVTSAGVTVPGRVRAIVEIERYVLNPDAPPPAPPPI